MEVENNCEMHSLDQVLNRLDGSIEALSLANAFTHVTRWTNQSISAACPAKCLLRAWSQRRHSPQQPAMLIV